MELFYPVKNPINQTNLFGANPAEYKPLHQIGHPGNDFECPLYTRVYAPCDGDVFYTFDSLGGDGLWIRVPNNGSPAYSIILWHMVPRSDSVHPYSVKTDGSITSVKAGDLLGYSGDSGFPAESTGPHLHLGVMPCDSTGEALYPKNGFLGCIDPQPFFNGKFAEDIVIEQKILSVATQAVQIISADTTTAPAVKEGFLQEILDIIKKYL